MELRVTRQIFTDKSSISVLTINGEPKPECWILEDKDRGLTYSMSESEITGLKKYGITAIPYGRYEVVVSFSNHFQKMLPLLVGVKGFAGVRMHSGNRPEDTDGCLLTGTEHGTDTVLHSHDAFDPLFAKIKKAMETEKVFITIAKA